jgi:hypothetical protein
MDKVPTACLALTSLAVRGHGKTSCKDDGRDSEHGVVVERHSALLIASTSHRRHGLEVLGAGCRLNHFHLAAKRRLERRVIRSGG